MNDPLLVGGFERFGNLRRDRERLVDRNRPVRDPIGERWPSTSSMTSAGSVGPLQAVDLRDVRMVQ